MKLIIFSGKYLCFLSLKDENWQFHGHKPRIEERVSLLQNYF